MDLGFPKEEVPRKGSGRVLTRVSVEIGPVGIFEIQRVGSNSGASTKITPNFCCYSQRHPVLRKSLETTYFVSFLTLSSFIRAAKIKGLIFSSDPTVSDIDDTNIVPDRNCCVRRVEA
jgi:hypothetical protein